MSASGPSGPLVLLSAEMFIKPLGQSVKTNIRSVFTLFASTLIVINNVR